jgi:homoserine kinase type II
MCLPPFITHRSEVREGVESAALVFALVFALYALAMAVLTPLPLESARALAARFGLDVTHVHGILAGSVNSNFELSLARGGRVFLRVYEEQNLLSAVGEARLLDHLAAHGVPTPRPLAASDGSFLIEHAGKPVALFPWVEGEALCQARVEPEHARRVGEALARVHLAGMSFEGAPTSRFRVDDLFVRLEEIEGAERSAEIADAARMLRRGLERHLERPPAPEVPLVHGDLFRDNVLWDGASVAALLDFESASRGGAAFDLMVTVLAWCFGDRLEFPLARALVVGYAAVRSLGEERAHLHDAAVFAALRFSITRITDFELRPRGAGVYKDFRRFVARLRAVEEIGASAWPSALGV